MATHSSILAWGIPWTEEPGRLQYMVLQRVRHDSVTKQQQQQQQTNSVHTQGEKQIRSFPIPQKVKHRITI